MTIGVVTSFTHNGREYELPISTDQRKEFTEELEDELNALDGVESASNAGTTQSWDSIRLEIQLDTVRGDDGRDHLVPNLRSLSPRIRNVFKNFTPLSSYDVLSKPEPWDAEQDIYMSNLYIIEGWFY